ncbi:MAG: hypothetical protein RIB31_18715 [Thalassobaculaceae bacterium]
MPDGLRALAGETASYTRTRPIFGHVLERFLPDTVRTDFLYPDDLVRNAILQVLGISAADSRLVGNRRFLVTQGCRSGECSGSKGLVVADTETGALCAVLYRDRSYPVDNRTGSARQVDRPVVRVLAEIFLPAPGPSPNTAADPLIDVCTAEFAAATQRLVPSGYWIERGEIGVRVAPDFRSAPEVAARFQLWDGAPRPF